MKFEKKRLGSNIKSKSLNKELFSQVDDLTKILNSMIFKFFQFMEYFDNVI